MGKSSSPKQELIELYSWVEKPDIKLKGLNGSAMLQTGA